MVPEAILKTAAAEKVDVIAIADHNEIRNGGVAGPFEQYERNDTMRCIGNPG